MSWNLSKYEVNTEAIGLLAGVRLVASLNEIHTGKKLCMLLEGARPLQKTRAEPLRHSHHVNSDQRY